MKFGRYLKDTQIPEWKKKYIDYRGLKKLIGRIQDEREALRSSPNPQKSDRPSDIQSPPSSPQTSRHQGHTPTAAQPSAASAMTTQNFDKLLPPKQKQADYGSGGVTPPLSANPKRSPSVRMMLPQPQEPLEGFSLPPPARSFTDLDVLASTRVRAGSAATPSLGLFPRLTFRRSRVTFGTPKSSFDTYAHMLESVTEAERNFFIYLDEQIEKVEDFYEQKYKEAVVRLSAIKEQFRELSEHRTVYKKAQESKMKAWMSLPNLPIVPTQALESAFNTITRHVVQGKAAVGGVAEEAEERAMTALGAKDPDSYPSAKKNLKHAVLEFHRFLELLKDYQALNVTAIRKSVKKFEKTTAMNVHDAFNRDRVNGLNISNDSGIKTMLTEVEKLYAVRFENGDLKKARNRMRNFNIAQNHHFSTFRSGILLGLSVPALVVGTYCAIHPNDQQQLERRPAMLQIYGTVGLPVLFSVLVSLNLIAWARRRINYVFIFDLSLRSLIDYREYVELPSFFFMTLSYAFMLSFSGLFHSHISPTAWPIAWLSLFCIVMIDPARLFHRPSRYWLLRNWIQLFLPGFTSVEFADFWMGDQFCSMTYSFSHFYYFGCVYAVDWKDPNTTCNLQRNWISGVLFASIPSAIRAIQCVKRYADSKNHIHLINGGKYLSSILQYGVFFNWRYHGMQVDSHLAIFVLFSIVASTYTAGWDLYMDWSLLRTHSEYPFLRPELLYGDYYPVYYFAMLTNVIIRFVWIIYVPYGTVDYKVRNFSAGALEMLRRVQWNFFRVENEHIGHADQYRVTRDIPLPYSFNDGAPQDDSDDEADKKSTGSDQAAANRSRESFVGTGPDRRSVHLRHIRSDSS